MLHFNDPYLAPHGRWSSAGVSDAQRSERQCDDNVPYARPQYTQLPCRTQLYSELRLISLEPADGISAAN